MTETSPRLQDVFRLSGVPTYTFVKPPEYTQLLVALQTDGRGIVVEGPSGIGKTTAVMKAIEEAGIGDHVITLSGRKLDDVEFIKELPEQRPFGIVIIDDFHRLPDELRVVLADLMKVLADEGADDSKLIILGINKAGESLIAFGTDLANRIEVIPFEANPQHKIEALVNQGQEALNCDLNVYDEIVQDAHGSFYIAQMLCYYTCLKAEILTHSNNRQPTTESYELIKGQVLTTLSRSFHETAISFARGTRLRREGRAPYLHLLYWLSQTDNWSINVEREADHHPELRGSISQIVTKGYLNDVIMNSDAISSVLHFEQNNSLLTVQDPQFVFYIRNLSWPRFAEEIGYLSLEFPSRYDFALSFAGTDRDIAEALFSQLQDNEFEVFYDRNEQHRILAGDVEDYLRPIYNSDAALVICILGRDYPKRIWTKFESEQFKQRFKTGEVIPIVLADVELGMFDTATKVGHISWDRSDDFETQANATTDVLRRKVADIRRRLRVAPEQ